MIIPKKETRNKYNNLLKRIRCQNYITNPCKTQNTYYKCPLINPKEIIEKIEIEKKLLRERLEKKENKEEGDLPIIKGKRYNSRYNEIKTFNKKDREKLEKLYGISPKINKIRNNSYQSNSYNNLGIRYQDRINYLCNNYIDVIISKCLKDRKHTIINKGKLSLFAQFNKKYIIKNYKFSFNQNNCSICLEKFLEKDNITYLPCLHLFHENCIFEWLKRKKNCPICKYKIL